LAGGDVWKVVVFEDGGDEFAAAADAGLGDGVDPISLTS